MCVCVWGGCSAKIADARCLLLSHDLWLADGCPLLAPFGVCMQIKRLKALKALHEQGSDFGRTLTQLEAAQQTMKSTITDESTMLTKV